jgi:pyruvate dehydrogenase E1 component alpha subunit
MALIRRFDERALELRLDGHIHGVVHPYIGQEAVAVGACSTLSRSDCITSTHRGHGHCIAKGANVSRMMAELFGRRDGYCKGKGGSMHIADFEVGMLGANGIVGAGLPVATGAALAARLTGSDNVAVCFFGEGATGEGEFHESLNFAGLWQLPVVFVCENNGWAMDTPPERALAAGGLAGFGTAHALPYEHVDGNDVLAVRDVVGRAVSRARAGDGATLVEAATFRHSIHVQRHDPIADTRPATLLEAWAKRDPIATFEALLVERGVLDQDAIKRVWSAANAEIEGAVAFAHASPFPEPRDALEDVFASPLETS